VNVVEGEKNLIDDLGGFLFIELFQIDNSVEELASL
jgi:hypothetical protein